LKSRTRTTFKVVRYLTIPDVLARFDISRATLYRWIKERDFPSARAIGRKRYYRLADVDAWDEKQSGRPIADPETALGLPIVSEVIQTYDDLVSAMRARREALGMSVLEADATSGLQDGYTSKLENPATKYGRGVGPDTLPLWLGGLRVGIVLVDLPRRPHRRAPALPLEPDRQLHNPVRRVA